MNKTLTIMRNDLKYMINKKENLRVIILNYAMNCLTNMELNGKNTTIK